MNEQISKFKTPLLSKGFLMLSDTFTLDKENICDVFAGKNVTFYIFVNNLFDNENI
jgi:hypothetical protein